MTAASPLKLRRFLICSFLATLAICGCRGPISAPPRDTLIRIADDEVKSLDPQHVSDLGSLRIAADQFEGLTRFDAAGRIEPGLAQNWTKSPDGRVWRFNLRPGLHFSDGEPIMPATFTAVFGRLRKIATASPTKALFTTINAMTAEGEAVVVTLKAPTPALPELLAHPALAALPLHRAQWLSERPMVSSGAYRLQDWALNDHLTLIRNQNWHDGPAPIARIRWQPISDPLSALRLFQAGGADTTNDFPSSRLAALRKQMPTAVHIAAYAGSYYFVFNTRKPPFNDVRVRRALNMAVDREWIAGQLLKIGNQPAWSVVPPGIGEASAYRPLWAQQSHSVKIRQARLLLAAAGYGASHPLRFDIKFNSDADHRRVSVALAAMWGPLGVEAHLLNTEASLHFAALRRGDFALARSGWIGDIAAPENYLNLYRSDAGPSNYSGYTNPRFDAALDAALHTTKPRARATAMRNAEAILIADAPVIPINYYVSKSLVAPRVSGWQDNPHNIHPSRTLRIK